MHKPIESETANGLHWYAVWSRSRHEKMVAGALTNLGITTFLPLVTETHRWSDRRKSVDVPLFPGYVFVQIPNTAEAQLQEGVGEQLTLSSSTVLTSLISLSWIGTAPCRFPTNCTTPLVLRTRKWASAEFGIRTNTYPGKRGTSTDLRRSLQRCVSVTRGRKFVMPALLSALATIFSWRDRLQTAYQ